MSSFATLSPTTAYLSLLQQISDRDTDLSKALDPATTSATTTATGAVRFNSANKRWETYSGTAWAETVAAATDAYNFTVTGLRGGYIYGAVTNSGSITGGTINAAVLQVAGSAAWTVASLTNLNQLTNGPAFISAAALAPYAPLAAPALTGIPTAPTAPVDTTTTQLATTQFVLNQGYLKAASANYLPLTGGTLTGDITTYRSAAPTTGGVLLGNSGTRYLYYDGTSYLLNGAQLFINSSPALHAANFNAYAPSLTGTGASGSWNITAAAATLAAKSTTLVQGPTGGSGAAMTFNWSGQTGQPPWLWGSSDGISQYVYNPSNFSVANSAQLGGFSANASGGGNTVALRDGNGYLRGNYLNMTDEGTSGSAGGAAISAIITKRGDDYYRSTTAGMVAAFLSGQAMNINGSATSVPWTGVTSRPTALSQFTNDATIGAGQAWVDMLATRTSGSSVASNGLRTNGNATNQTGRQIMVTITVTTQFNPVTGATTNASVTVGAVMVFATNGQPGSFSTSFIVPDGVTYGAASGGGISVWAELR